MSRPSPAALKIGLRPQHDCASANKVFHLHTSLREWFHDFQETIPAQDSMARDDEEESTIQPLEAVKVEKPQVSQPSRLEDVPV